MQCVFVAKGRRNRLGSAVTVGQGRLDEFVFGCAVLVGPGYGRIAVAGGRTRGGRLDGVVSSQVRSLKAGD